jgi:glucose uptake protein GlcU
MIHKTKIEQETRVLYKDSERSTLKMMILLVSFEKFMFSNKSIFIFMAIGPLLASLYLFKKSGNIQVFLIAFLIHGLCFQVIKKWFQMDGMAEDYEEARIKYDELKKMLEEKREQRNDKLC